MAKVFLTLNSWARAKNNPSSIKLLESNNIPYEKAGTTIYLISKESNKSSVDIISREYNKPYSKFCMQLSDSALGSIYMGEDILEKKLLIDPIVNIRHLNFEVTVIGEVGRPTVITVPSEKISLLKALGLAGDITIYGRKDNVLLVRESEGKNTVKHIDLNSKDFLTSPYYYLQPNDIIYVERFHKRIIQSIQDIAPIFSVFSLVLTLLVLFKR